MRRVMMRFEVGILVDVVVLGTLLLCVGRRLLIRLEKNGAGSRQKINEDQLL